MYDAVQGLAVEGRRRRGEPRMPDAESWAGVFGRGEAVGVYRIDAILGEGGMGVVYRANHAAFHRDVAIKVLPRARSTSRTFRERFDREAEALKQLSHRNIVSIIDKGSKDDNHYLVMELLSGRSLEERLRDGALPAAEAFELMLQIIDAVQYAHDRGIIHRDLKPANILLDDLGVPKVADFGIAQSMIRAEGDQMQADEQVGTAEYAAPEQLADASSVDRRTDVYALGALLYEMLTGLPPVGRLKPVHELARGVRPKVDRVIRRAMSPDKEERFETAALMGEALRQAQGILPEEAPAPASGTAAGVWAGVAAAAVILGAAGWLVLRGAGAPKRATATAEAPKAPGAEAAKAPVARTQPLAPATVPRPEDDSAPAQPAAQPRTASAPKPPEVAASGVNDLLAKARKDVAAGRFAAALASLSARELSGNAEAGGLLSRAQAGERARLADSAKRSAEEGRWDAGLAQVDAAAKLGRGQDLQPLRDRLLEGKRAWLIERAKGALEADPKQAVNDLNAAQDIRKGNDVKLLLSRVRHYGKLAEEKEEAEKKHAAWTKRGDLAAERNDRKMARQWYQMALQVKDTPEVRRKLEGLTD